MSDNATKRMQVVYSPESMMLKAIFAEIPEMVAGIMADGDGDLDVQITLMPAEKNQFFRLVATLWRHPSDNQAPVLLRACEAVVTAPEGLTKDTPADYARSIRVANLDLANESKLLQANLEVVAAVDEWYTVGAEVARFWLSLTVTGEFPQNHNYTTIASDNSAMH